MQYTERRPGSSGGGAVLQADFGASRRRGPSSSGSWAGANWSSPVTVGRNGRVRVYPYQDVWMVEPDGPLDQLADDVDHSVQCLLAEFPRAVVCTVPGSLDQLSWATLDTLASIGRHARAWPETPLVLACHDPQASTSIAGRREGRHLRFASSALSAWTHVMLQPPLLGARMTLPAAPTAARAARRFVAQACEEWGLTGCAASGTLVVSELATNALQHAGTDLQVALASDGDSFLRIGVRDRVGRAPSTRAVTEDDHGGRGLHIVESVARRVGALPTSDGGKVVWATVVPDGT